MAATNKILIALDFDYTIADGDYDKGLANILPGDMPANLKAIYNEEKKWSEYMNGLFDQLHKHKVSPTEIKRIVNESALIDGMKELFEYISEGNYDVVVVSDGNAMFIDWVLREHGIRQHVSHIFANPAEFNADGKIEMAYYHKQDWCNLSTFNLCKGKAITDHIEKKKIDGVVYTRTIFIGDGNNDYCPTLELSTNDYVFPRLNFPLDRRLREDKSKVKAKVVTWQSGKEIAKALESIH